VFIKPNPHSQRSSRPCCASGLPSLISFTSFVSLTSFNSFPVISFADPHPLTLLKSYRFKYIGGRGARCATAPYPSKSFSYNTYRPPRKCCKQKTYSLAKSFSCNTYTKQGVGPSLGVRGSRSDMQTLNAFPTYPLSFQTIAHSLAHAKTQLISFQAIPHSPTQKQGGGVPTPQEAACKLTTLLNYLLMSSFASRRLSKGCRNGLVWSGAPLIACVISLAAVGKSPLFDEIRANARWLIQ
jgi:hypothetical protein